MWGIVVVGNAMIGMLYFLGHAPASDDAGAKSLHINSNNDHDKNHNHNTDAVFPRDDDVFSYGSLSSSATERQLQQQQLLLLKQQLEQQQQQLVQKQQQLEEQMRFYEQQQQQHQQQPQQLRSAAAFNPRVPPYFEVLSAWKPRAFIWRGMVRRNFPPFNQA